MNNIDIDTFPVNSWVKIKIGDRRYMGRALRNERTHIVATVDDAGKSITFSWPYICENATSVEVIPVVENGLN